MELSKEAMLERVQASRQIALRGHLGPFDRGKVLHQSVRGPSTGDFLEPLVHLASDSLIDLRCRSLVA